MNFSSFQQEKDTHFIGYTYLYYNHYPTPFYTFTVCSTASVWYCCILNLNFIMIIKMGL